MQLRAFSFGGGVQSTACLVLAAQGKIDFPNFVFANTGNDSERQATLKYIEAHSKPFAIKHGINFHVVEKTVTLLQHLTGPNRTIAIPMFLKDGGPGNRTCTIDWKIKPIAKWCRQNGATMANPALVGIGISRDEWMRAKDSRIKHLTHEHPLLKLDLSRGDCANIIRNAGLPLPPKSACWFCPYAKMHEWQEMVTHEPEQFAQAVNLENTIREKRRNIGQHDQIFLTRRQMPLDQAVLPNNQLKLPLDDECSGFCWT